MSHESLSELIGRDQTSSLVTALGRLVGLEVRLTGEDGTALATREDADGPVTLPEPGEDCQVLSFPVVLDGRCWATIVVGPFRMAGRKRIPKPCEASQAIVRRIPNLSRARVDVVKGRTLAVVQLLIDMGKRQDHFGMPHRDLFIAKRRLNRDRHHEEAQVVGDT